MTKVMLCGEGAHDVGLLAEWDSRRSRYVDLEGWMQPIIRNSLGGDIKFSVRRRRDITLLPRHMKGRKPLPGGHGAKALMSKLIAEKDGCDIVIFMVDADDTDETVWRGKRAQILAGFAASDIAVHGIACVPKSASECWLLSDESAWKEVGLDIKRSPLPRRPEEIWGGRDDPQGNHPHRLFTRMCEAAGVTDSRDTRFEIAMRSQLNVIVEGCPISFGAFLTDVAAITAD